MLQRTTLGLLLIAVAGTPVVAQSSSGGAHPADLAALKAADPAAALVTRDGFAQAGDGGAADYRHVASACALKDGDGGSQVPARDGGCWVLVPPPAAVNVAVWGASPAAADNGPALDAAFRWSAAIGGAHLSLSGGRFVVRSTFDCHAASGTSLEGTGNTTVLYRTADYGSTMTCADAQNIRIANLWALQDIGADPTIHFDHPTANAAHFDFTNVTHFVFDHVTAWNANYNFRITSSIDGLWIDPLTNGFWDDAHHQTIASMVFDGVDGTGLGHPQLMRIIAPDFGSALLRDHPLTLTSGGRSRTLAKMNLPRGPFDHVLIKAMEDFEIVGGIGGDAVDATLHLAPRGDMRRPILEVHTAGLFYDGAGRADVLIENEGVKACNARTAAHHVTIADSFMDGELVGPTAVEVPRGSPCAAVTNLNLSDLHAQAYVRTPFKLGAVDGGTLSNSSAINYNTHGVFANDVAGSSAAWIFGLTTSFHVMEFAAGGGQSLEPIDPAHPPGVEPYGPNQSQYGVSIEGGLVNVTRRGIVNNGYYADYAGAAPAVACGHGCAAGPGADNGRGMVSTAAGSGPITTVAVSFNGPLARTALPQCRSSDAMSATGLPVASAIKETSFRGFSVVFAASIGEGGSFRYDCQ